MNAPRHVQIVALGGLLLATCKVAQRGDYTFTAGGQASVNGGTDALSGGPALSGGSGGTEASAHTGGAAIDAGGGISSIPGEEQGGAASAGSSTDLESEGGAGGEGPSPCAPEDTLRCAGEARPERELCKGGAWQSAQACAANENCDNRDGSCGSIPEACAGRRPRERFCEENTLVSCGPDLLTVESAACEGRCVPSTGGAECASPACGDGVEQPGEQCDDQNDVNGDGCSSACLFEPVGVFVGGAQSCALDRSGRLRCWGDNAYGELGLGDTQNRDESSELGEALPAPDLGAHSVRAIATGFRHSCGILDDGSVRCWGGNELGQLGHGDLVQRGDRPGEMGAALPITELGGSGMATAIAAGEAHTCVILSGGRVKCWGNNAQGQLGVGDVNARGDAANEMGESLPAVYLGPNRTAKQLALGVSHSCVILDTDNVKCWGANAQGQLGQGDTNARADQRAEMDSLVPVALGAGRTARGIAAGLAHTCALLDDGTVKCWGNNAHGELGLGDTVARGDGPSEMGDALAAVNLGRKALAVVAGSGHNCALLDDGSVKCWGDNAVGELGLGDTQPRGDGPGEMGNALPAVDLGQGRTARMLSAGRYHTCALLDDGSIRCWGLNNFGQLGTGTTRSHGNGVGPMGDALPPVALRF